MFEPGGEFLMKVLGRFLKGVWHEINNGHGFVLMEDLMSTPTLGGEMLQ